MTERWKLPMTTLCVLALAAAAQAKPRLKKVSLDASGTTEAPSGSSGRSCPLSDAMDHSVSPEQLGLAKVKRSACPETVKAAAEASLGSQASKFNQGLLETRIGAASFVQAVAAGDCGGVALEYRQYLQRQRKVFLAAVGASVDGLIAGCLAKP